METNKPIVESLKNIMRDLVVPLTIVTAASEGQKRAVTISSFTCHSMKPPLITFNIDCGTQFCGIIRSTSHFAVHFPTQKHAGLCQRFAGKGLSGEEQFSDVDYFENEYGTPVIRDISSVIYCTRENLIQIGDHIILVGRVLSASKSGQEPGLLYHHQSFTTLQV